MKKLNIGVFALSALLFAGSAFAGSCPRHIRQIDAELAKSPQLSQADMGKVKGLREKGEAFHKAGTHSKSIKALRQAKALLGI